MTMEWEIDEIGHGFAKLFREDGTEAVELRHVELCEYDLKIEVLARVHGQTIYETGLMQWEAGTALAEVMSLCPALFKDRVVAELGCGCAPFPSLMAHFLGAGVSLVTDGSERVLHRARQNFERNRAPSDAVFHFQRLMWGNVEELRCLVEKCPRSVDWILAADVAYNDEGTRNLFQTVSCWMHLSPNARFLLAFVVRGVSEQRILQLARRVGLSEEAIPEGMHPAAKTPFRLHLFAKGSRWPDRICMKCDTPATAVVRQRDPLCRSCLLNSVESKFRSLFKIKAAISPGDRILLDGTGTIESQALLNCLLRYRNPEPHKIRRNLTHFSLEIVHRTQSNSASVLDAIRALIMMHGDAAEGVHIYEHELPEIKWDELCSEWDRTDVDDLKCIYRVRFLLAYAQSRECNVLACADSATSIAQHMLSQSCKGGGFGVNAAVDLFDTRFLESKGVTVVRPLKDVSIAELALSCRYQEIGFVGTAPRTASVSIDGISEEFVHALPNSFPSGVSSLLKMGSKLVPHEWQSVSLCDLCCEPLLDSAADFCYRCRTHILERLAPDNIDSLLKHFEFEFR